MNDKNKKVDQAKEDEKQLKKLLESYTTVASHKLGRPATLEDLTKMLTENTDQEQLGAKPTATPVTSKPVAQRSIDRTSDTTPAQPAQGTQAKPTASAQASQPMDKAEEPAGNPAHAPMPVDTTGQDPKILHMQIFYGMSGDGEARKPDPGNILYYKHPDGRYYDTSAQSWSDTQPPMCQHLSSRPVQFNERDIVAAIAHGVMDEQDYQALDKAQMIGHTPRHLWELTSKLKTLHTDLKKSEEPEAEETEAPESDPELSAGAEPSQGKGMDAVGEFFSTAGVERGGQEDSGASEVGEDLIKQIMEAAVEAVSDAMSAGMADKIRAIVKEELAKANGGGDDLTMASQDATMTEI